MHDRLGIIAISARVPFSFVDHVFKSNDAHMVICN